MRTKLRLDPLKAKTVAEFYKRYYEQGEPCLRSKPTLRRYKHLGLSGWTCMDCGHVAAPE